MNWYCVHTKPSKEEHAALYLRDVLGLEEYLPRLKRKKTIRRVRRVVVSPLFPRYLFCRFDPAVHYRAVRHAPEVIGTVSYGGEPTIVQDALVSELRSWVGESLDATTLVPGFRPGDAVEITDGPFQGLHASVVQEMPDRDRVAILLDVLTCGARMTVNRSQLRPVG